MGKKMNFEDLSSESFSNLFVEEFGPDDGKKEHTISASHSLKNACSRRNLIKKATSIRNVMLGTSSSDLTALLSDSCGELDSMDEIEKFDEELDGAQKVDSFREKKLDDLFKGKFEDDTSSQSQPVQPNTEQAIDDAKQDRKAPVSARRRRMGRSGLSRDPSLKSPLARSPSTRKLVVDPLSTSDHGTGRRTPVSRSPSSRSPSNRGRPKLSNQMAHRRRRSGGRRDNTSTPKANPLQSLETGLGAGCDDDKPRIQASKSSSDAEKRTSKPADVAVRRTRSSAGGRRSSGEAKNRSSTTGRRAGRKSDYIVEERVSAKDVDEPKKSPVVSGERGRTRTSNDDPQEHVDRRVEWRSKSRSRRNLMEGPQSREQRFSRSPARPSRPTFVRAESLNGQRLSQLNM